MPVDERELRLRRIKRQMKAGASIVLAVAAGAFLACQRNVTRVVERSPMGPDARSGPVRPPPVDASASPVDASASPVDAPSPTDATVDASADASANTLVDAPAETGDARGLVVRDASAQRHHRVDVHEHRRGLPVIDNLLE